MGPAVLVVAMVADALVGPVDLSARPLRHAAPRIVATLPVAAADWPMRRCGDDAPGTEEASAEEAIDRACARLAVRERPTYRIGPGRWTGGSGGGGGGGGSGAWRVARAVLPGLEGLVGRGGIGLGLGGEVQLVRGARLTLHLAAARDTRIAPTAFAPDATVRARCGACWEESEALGAGLVGGARRTPSSTPAH